MSNKTLKKRDIARTRVFAGMDGGEIHCISPEGEMRWKLGFMPGYHHVNFFETAMGPRDELEVHGDLYFVGPSGSAVKAVKHPLKRKSGANSDYRPQRLTDFEKQMLARVDKMAKDNKATKRRLKQAEALVAKREAVMERSDDEEAQREERKAKREASGAPEAEAAAQPAKEAEAAE